MSGEASEDSKVFFLLKDNEKERLESNVTKKDNPSSLNDDSEAIQLEPLTDDTYSIELDFKKFGVVKNERRQRLRVPYWGQVFIHEKDSPKTITAHAKDINATGIGLTLPTKSLVVGKEIVIEFLGSGNLKAFTLEARVKNVAKQRGGSFNFGFEVINISKLTLKKIQDYIEGVIESESFSDTDAT